MLSSFPETEQLNLSHIELQENNMNLMQVNVMVKFDTDDICFRDVKLYCLDHGLAIGLFVCMPKG